jgi:5-methylcytosine-specific restriction endonuclease McrA
MSARWHGRKGRPWRRLRAEVLASSDVCWLCGLPGANTVDHVLPLSQFPELAHDRSNLAPAHHRCNSSKGASTMRTPTAASRRW